MTEEGENPVAPVSFDGSDDLGVEDWDDSVPEVPTTLGSDLDSSLREKLHRLLYANTSQLGSVYRAMVVSPKAGPTELLSNTNCANAGAVGNRRIVILAIMNGIEPTAASVASQAASTVRALRKSALNDRVKEHLESVLHSLLEKAVSEAALEDEEQQLESDSTELAKSLNDASGVYVYTYPHYWRHPYLPDSQRRLLKIGRTSNKAWARVLGQARQTGMPEDPLLLRVYAADAPVEVERSFHLLLDAAEHERSAGRAVGREWFLTTLEYCDTIAAVLGLQILKGSSSEPH